MYPITHLPHLNFLNLGAIIVLLLPFHHEPGKPRRFQLFQHPVGVGADGEGSHLDPVQHLFGVGLGFFGRLLRLSRDEGHAQVLAQALGDGLADLRGVLHDPLGTLHRVVEFALTVHRGSRRSPHLVKVGVLLHVLGRSRRQRGQLVEHRLAGVVPLAGDGVAEQPGAHDLLVAGVGVDAVVNVRLESVGLGAALGHGGAQSRHLHLHAAAAQGRRLRLGDLLALGVLVGVAPGVSVAHLVAGADVDLLTHRYSPLPAGSPLPCPRCVPSAFLAGPA